MKKAKKKYYYTKRTLYNARTQSNSEQASLFIFLNRTCFNGLHRVNRNNEFNVPMGTYKMPLICDRENIIRVSQALKKVEILCGDFEQTLYHATANTLFYLDPPYKPLTATAAFTAYATNDFNDGEQVRLHNFCRQLNANKHCWVLSNSDVPGDFFRDLYSGYSIQKVAARRAINSNAQKRGKLHELLITNNTKKPSISK